jgi:prepilin-type N-terminal cleavage/methylation domain-containing protein/prepilin-type processing-associated H-X9-DG protein
MKNLTPQGGHPSKSRAFSLIEILITVGVLGVLATLSLAGVSSLTEHGKRVREINAARTLVTAYLTRAAENNGELMPGYQFGSTVTSPNGDVIGGEEANRYPYRLADYLDWEIEGVYLINDTLKAVKGLDPASPEYRYRVSLTPALGMNMYCVGGNYTSSGLLFAKDVVRRVAEVERPQALVVFVSTAFRQGPPAGQVEGYFYARPPRFSPASWNAAAPTADSNPNQYGFVHFRHNGRALCAFLDGHQALMSADELRDMRHWAPKADSPSYLLKP